MLFCTNTRESSQQVYNSGKALGSELVSSTRDLSLSEPRALPEDWQGRSRRKEPSQPGSSQAGGLHAAAQCQRSRSPPFLNGSSQKVKTHSRGGQHLPYEVR